MKTKTIDEGIVRMNMKGKQEIIDGFDYHWWEDEFKEKFGTGLNSMEDRLILNTQSRTEVGDYIRYVVSKTVDMVRNDTKTKP